MFSLIEELFLREYFLHNEVLGDYCPKKEVFHYLAQAFGITAKRANFLFEQTEQQSVLEIHTEADANRYKRIAQFQAINNKSGLYDEQTDALIAIKTEAITAATQMDMCLERKTPKSKVFDVLSQRASSGIVDAMRVLGTLQINGFFLEKNRLAGRKNLVNAAEWGDVISMFLLLRAGVANFEMQNNFYFATCNTPYEVLFKVAQSGRFVPNANKAEIVLLNKLFALHSVKRTVYSQMHAHVIYADGLSSEDKEKILFSENKQFLSDALNMPIYRPTDTGLTCDTDAITQISLKRESEQYQIVSALRNRDFRWFATYRPLCLCTNSQYLQEIYAEALEKCFKNEIVARIDVNGLQEIDFEPTANNVFISSCKCASDGVVLQKLKSDTNNVFLLILNGDVSASTMKHIKNFLSTEWRRQFRLARPNVTLDFSYALPICICDSDNADKLKTLVETVHIAEVNSDEASVLIGEMLANSADMYFGKDVELTDNAIELLVKLPLEAVAEIVDTAFRAQRVKFDSQDKVAFAMKPYIDSYNRQHQGRCFGFGGYNK